MRQGCSDPSLQAAIHIRLNIFAVILLGGNDVQKLNNPELNKTDSLEGQTTKRKCW